MKFLIHEKSVRFLVWRCLDGIKLVWKMPEITKNNCLNACHFLKNCLRVFILTYIISVILYYLCSESFLHCHVEHHRMKHLVNFIKVRSVIAYKNHILCFSSPKLWPRISILKIHQENPKLTDLQSGLELWHQILNRHSLLKWSFC